MRMTDNKGFLRVEWQNLHQEYTRFIGRTYNHSLNGYDFFMKYISDISIINNILSFKTNERERDDEELNKTII